MGSVVSYKGEVVMSQNLVTVKVTMEFLRSFPRKISRFKFQSLNTTRTERSRAVITESQLSLVLESVELMNRYLPRFSAGVRVNGKHGL